MAMSVLGTVFRGYFFAFHLLNIVNNNQLLKGVIQAVTQNGHYLLSMFFLFFQQNILKMLLFVNFLLEIFCISRIFIVIRLKY